MNKEELIIDYLKEQKSYIEICEAIIRSMPDVDVEDVKEIPIVKSKLGFIMRDD